MLSLRNGVNSKHKSVRENPPFDSRDAMQRGFNGQTIVFAPWGSKPEGAPKAIQNSFSVYNGKKWLLPDIGIQVKATYRCWRRP